MKSTDSIRWFLFYWHLREDGRVDVRVVDENPVQLAFAAADNYGVRQKRANLFSNQVAFFLTIFSWYFVGGWICSALFG